MPVNIRIFRLLQTAFIIILSAGCRDSPTLVSTTLPSPIPASPTNTITVPEASPTPQPTSIPFEIIFNGKACVGALPEKLPLGDHSFNLLDQTDLQAELWLVRLTDGKTFQDLLDMQSAPGEWDPKPRWASYDTQLSRETLETDDGRLETTIWKFYLVGEHVVFCYITSPQMIYYAGPIMIVEALSE